MNKIGIRLIIIILLVGAIIYIANFKYKAVQKHFFVEGAEVTNESMYVILNEKNDTLYTESLEIQKGTYQVYYESKKFKIHSNNISEAFRLVTDTSGNLLWGSYEKFIPVNSDSVTRSFAFYSTFQPELMRTLPVIGFRDKPKQDIDLTKDYLVFNGLYSTMNAQGWSKRTENKTFEFISLDTTVLLYKLGSIESIYLKPDSTKKFSQILVSDKSDTLITIVGIPDANSVNLIIDHKNKLWIKRVYGRDYQYKVLDQKSTVKPVK